jgi:hypothetical protein
VRTPGSLRPSPPPHAADSTEGRRRTLWPIASAARLVVAALSVALVASAVPAAASALDIRSATKSFYKRPKAALALQIAKAHLGNKQVGQAMNWAESAIACKDAKPATTRIVQRWRAKQKWRLNDLGYGLVKLNVRPSNGRVTIDDRPFRPARGHYELWLKSGTHHLQIDMPDYRSEDRIITAARGETRVVNTKMQITRPPQLHLDVTPRSAEAWVDNKRLGPVSRKVFSITEGGHVLELRAYGHRSWTRTVRLRSGDILPLTIALDKVVPDKRAAKLASQVERKLTSYEKNSRGGRAGLIMRDNRKRDPAKVRVEKPTDNDDAAKPATPSEEDSLVPEPSSGPVPDDVEDEDDGPDSDATAGDAGESDDDDSGSGDSAEIDPVPEAPVRRSTHVRRGMWLTTGGLIVAAGGVAWTLSNVSDAYFANGLRLGHSKFDSYYEDVQQLTTISYAVIGAGGVLTGLGGLYLLSSSGATRKGKGYYFAATGLLTAAAGGYLMFDAANKIDTLTAEFATGDPRRDAGLDGLYATHQAGLVTAGVGGAIAALGAYLIATGGKSRTSMLDGNSGDALANVRIAPRLRNGAGGLDLSVTF